jgi:uncharacterized protein (TIGR03066 family)
MMPAKCLMYCLGLLVLGFLNPPGLHAADKPEGLIVGKWKLVKPKVEGTLEFTKEGKLLIKFRDRDKKEIEVTGTYRFLPDGQMEVELTYQGLTKKEKLKVKVTAKDLATTDSKNKNDLFQRIE